MFKVTVLILFSSFLAGSDSDEIKVIVEQNVPVPMRDGTILRADVYRPDRGGPYPVLVLRTPYGKGGNFDRFVKAGYIVVSQDVRGRYESEGEWELFRLHKHDAEDGYDTVEWAAKLPGSNHKVGTFGISALAEQQWLLAALSPPSLAVMSAQSIMVSRYDEEPTGAIRPASLLKGLATTYRPDMLRRRSKAGVHTSWEASRLWEQSESDKWINFLPWSELLRGLFPELYDDVIFWMNNPQFERVRLDEICKNVSVPNLEITGWYDFCNGDMLIFRTMTDDAETEEARKGSKIIIGPWGHGWWGQYVGAIDFFGSDAALDNIAVQIRWFDYWLKGVQNGVDKDAPVKIFVMGDNKWRDEQQWPPQRAKDKILFIVSNGHANTPAGDGKLVYHEPEKAGKDQYLYDPEHPVLTLIDPVRLYCPADQRPLASREDILVYQTEPLGERVEVTGNPVVELYASSSAPDTDWFVRLIDVAPDGLAMNVSLGVVRARYRNGFDRPEFIEPGEVVKYSIRMRPTSNSFLPGHRIRLDITSSDFPNYDRNHNTAKNQNVDATLAIANQTIYNGGERATRIILPWVPNPIEKEKPEVQLEKQTDLLSKAVAERDIKQLTLLISKGADVNTKDEGQNTPLHYAAEAGNIEVVRLLVEAGANVNAKDNEGMTPLHHAARRGHRNVAELLIAQGANVNAKDNEGRTPLHRVARRGHKDVAELLIAQGANVNAKDNEDMTPLHHAARRGHRDVAELLIAQGANVNAKDNEGMTPLSFTPASHQIDIAELLLTKGADISSKDGRGLTVLHNAAVEGQRDIAELLLSKGAKVDERDDNYEFTALHYAARFGSTKVAEVLIAHGADIRAKDKWGYEPIHWAAYHDRPEIIELLIAKGADVNAKTSLGQTPLELAVPRRNTASIEVMRKYSNNTDSDKHYVVLERGDVRAVIVNNEPVDDEVLPGHRGGYSGVASLTHRDRDKNIFVPFYAGLNFEHIHDGTNQPRDILFEPRHAPIQIKRIDEYTAELYQPPTPHWQLESRLRYKLLDDGVIEMTLECIPRARTFKNDYIGLFFASYIDKPESLDIHFLGRPADQTDTETRWIRGVTPEHGVLSTHLAVDDNRNFAHEPNFPLTLVFNKSNYRYAEPWYYGVSGGMAFVLMFRPSDKVRFSQSPSGGGNGNPAWDFQWFVPHYEVGKRYRFVMRAMYLPLESPQQIIRATARHRAALEQ